MIKLIRKISKNLGRRTIAASLALIIGITALLPSIVDAHNLILWITHPNAYPTWGADIEAKGNSYFAGKLTLPDVSNLPSKSATGMAFNQNFFNGFEDAGFTWPLGAVMYLEPIDGKDNTEYKEFEFRHTFCTANHVNALVLQHGARAFCSGVYNVNKKFLAAEQGDPDFNFTILAIACAYPENYTINRNAETIAEDSATTEDVICQLIAWCATDAGAGFTGEWEHDFNLFHTQDSYYDRMMSSFAAASPDINNKLHDTPEPYTGAWASGEVSNYAEAVFYDIWTAAKLTSQLANDWNKNFTFIGSSKKEENGQYKAIVTLKDVPKTVSSYLFNIPFNGYGDWKLEGTTIESSKTSNVIDVIWELTSATGETDSNGCIGTLEYEPNDIRSFMPTDMTKAKIYTFDTWNLNYSGANKFDHTQTQFASVIEKGLKLYVKFGESSTPDADVSVHRYEHTENWKANYNVNLYKLDSETGKPIAGSHWDILEKFDDSQLDNTDLDRTPDNPGSFDVETGSLVATEWGDDTVADNYSGNMSVLDADANKYNWRNDSGSQFERWDDPEEDPCKRDDNVTKDDGKLYEADSAGNATSDTAHTDVKNYTYHKGYCGGHPAPEIEYEELTGDPETDEQIEEDNQAIHDEAWAEWYSEVAICEQLVKEGGFFHSINPDEAKAAMEADRDEFYKQFISLTYEYSAKETKAAPGYILHGTHTDDIPIEWRVVTSSEYKDTDEATNLEHQASAGGGTSSSTDTDEEDKDDGDDEEEEGEALDLTDRAVFESDDTANVITTGFNSDEGEVESTTITVYANAADVLESKNTANQSETPDTSDDMTTVTQKTDDQPEEQTVAAEDTVKTEVSVNSENTTPVVDSSKENITAKTETNNKKNNSVVNENRNSIVTENEDGVLSDGDVLDDVDVATKTELDTNRPEPERVSTGFIKKIVGAVKNLFATAFASLDDEDSHSDQGAIAGGSYLRNTLTFEKSKANYVKPAAGDIIDWTFIVYDHRTEGEIHFNKKDFDLKNDENDTFDSYGIDNGDGTLEGAVYGLFAAEDIVHPDAETGTVYKKGDLVAVATTDRNGDASFMTFTESPGSSYDYDTGSIVEGNKDPKNLHMNENASAAFSEDIELFVGHNPDNSEITTGNGKDLTDTSAGDDTYHWKYSSNQEYDSGMLENNKVANNKADTYRSQDTSGHYPISNNEDNNGNCWIGRPLIVGKSSQTYYIKELSRSEGYELSVSGKNDELMTNKKAFEDGGDVVTSTGTATPGSISEDKYSGGASYQIVSSDTDNGYIVYLTNIPEGATISTTTTEMVWDNSVSHYENKTTYVPVEATAGAPVMLGNKMWSANLGDQIEYNGKSFTVNNTYTVTNDKQQVSPTNSVRIDNPYLNTTEITISDDVTNDINKMFTKNGFRIPIEGSPWISVEVASLDTQTVADAINTTIFADEKYGVFNAFRMAGSYTDGGKTYAVISYSSRDEKTDGAVYDEKTGRILVKTDASYDGATGGYIYRTYELSECESVVKNDAGFVTSAIVPNEYASGTAEYRKGNPYDSISFKKRENVTYWAYAEGETLLSADGSEVKTAVTTTVSVKPTLVPKTVDNALTVDSFTVTGTSPSGYNIGTYTYTMSQADINNYADGKIKFRITFDDDTATASSKNNYCANHGSVSTKLPVFSNGSYIETDTLIYESQDRIVADNETSVVPTSVEERPIRQQVKVSKDIETLPQTLKVWYCANDGVENSDESDTCSDCGRKRTVEATKTIDFAHDTYAAFFNEDLAGTKQETNWISRAINWMHTVTGVTGSEDTSKAVANFRFKAYLKSNLERLYRDENGQVVWVDRNGNEMTPNYVDTNGDGLYETFTWTTYNGVSDFPEKDKMDGNAITSANVQKIFTKVEHLTSSYMTSAIANNMWNQYSNPEGGAYTDVSERNNYFNTNERNHPDSSRNDDAVKTNISLYSYEGDNVNVHKTDKIRSDQNNEYSRILESTEKVIEDGAGKTRTVHEYNYEKFFDAIASANADKWDDSIDTCTFKYNGYETPVGRISMQSYPGQLWEDTLREENQKGDTDNSFDLFRWIHEKLYGSVQEYQVYEGATTGANTETTTSTSDYAKANAEASNAVRQFAVKWYLQDEVAKLVKNNGVGDGEDIAKTEAEGGAPGITTEGVVPYDDYVHDYALFKALQKAYNYLRPFYENDLDTIYSVEWDSAENGGNDKDVTTLSVDNHENGAFYNISAYLPYGVYVVVEQTPANSLKETGYDLVNRAFNIEKPKEVMVPSVYDGESSNDTTDNYDTHYSFDITKTPEEQAKSSNYLIRFNEEWQDENQRSAGTSEHVIRAHSYYGDFEVFKYGLDVDKIGKESGSTINANGTYAFRGFNIAQSVFDPLKDYYSVGHNGESKDGVMTRITKSEGGEGTNDVRYPLADLKMNNTQTANNTDKYDIDSLINRFYYASVSEDNGVASGVIYKGGGTDDNNVSGMFFKDGVKTVTGELTAYEGKYAQMLVPWTVTAPADISSYSSNDFTGYADVNERDTFKTTKLTIRKVDAETGEQIIHDDTVFGLYAASRYTSDAEIKSDANKLSGDEKVKFLNQFKPGDTKFYLEDTKVYGSKEFLEAMGAYDISYVLTLDKGKAKRYGGHGYVRMSESEIRKLFGADGYTKMSGTIEYGVYHLDVLSGTSIPDDEEVTWYYSVYNTDSPICVGIIPKGTPICSEKNAVILEDNFDESGDSDETRFGMQKAYSTLNDVLMEDEDKAGTASYHLQNTGYFRTPQPVGSGCYVLAELKTPSGYLRAKPQAYEVYSDSVYYYESGDMFKKAQMVDYAKRIDQNEAYAK